MSARVKMEKKRMNKGKNEEDEEAEKKEKRGEDKE